MDTILFLRSYGDFIVALYAMNNSSRKEPIHIAASSHLMPLYDAVTSSTLPQISFEFIDIGISHGLLSGFTNRYLLSAATLSELKTLRSYIYKITRAENKKWYVEQYRGKSLVALATGISFDCVHKEGNIYNSWFRFFNTRTSAINEQVVSKIKNIVVFPGSRKKEKIIPDEILQKIGILFSGEKVNINIAFFKEASLSSGNRKHLLYNDFKELIDIVQQADFIISSDSLTAHLSQLYKKPHWIFYNRKINEEWLTPFASEHKAYAFFTEVEKLSAFLKPLL